MTVYSLVKKVLTKSVCLALAILVERHQYTMNITTRIIISITTLDPILCTMLWNHPRGSSPDNWSVSCSAKLSRLLEEGRCREPARDIPLVTKVMRKGARHTQRRDRASGVPLDILEHLPPKKPESAYFIALCSHLWLYWGLSPTTISLSLSKS